MKRGAKSRRLAASALAVCVRRERKWSGPHVSMWVGDWEHVNREQGTTGQVNKDMQMHLCITCPTVPHQITLQQSRQRE
jgi:hypothetical protein